MAHGVFADVRTEVRGHTRGAALLGELGDHPLDVARRGRTLGVGVGTGDGVDFGPVAGGHAKRFADARAIEQGAEQAGHRVAVHRKSLAHLEGCFAMREPYDDDQGRPPSPPRATTSSAASPAGPAEPRTRYTTSTATADKNP